MDSQQIGRYRIDGTLGSGAMGVVYRAFDTHIMRPVALKTIRKELMVDEQRESLLARFRNEVIAAGRLVHPNIVTVFDFGEDPENAFIAMELVEGKPLNRLVPKGQREDRSLVVNWVSQLLKALEFAHSMNIVHRDIKPGNLMVTPRQQLKITDFGVAKIDTTTMTQMGSIVGTPNYMSPEQFRGEVVDGRADLFSAAVILYQLLTGIRPFQGSPTAVMHGIMNVSPARPSEVCPDIPLQYDAVVMKGLAKQADERFATANDFRKALRHALEQDSSAHDVAGGGDADDDQDTIVPMSPRTGISSPAHPSGRTESGGAAPQQGTHGSTVNGTAPTIWDPGFLHEVEASMVSHIGPVAGPLVRKVAAQCQDVEQLSLRILEKVGSVPARDSLRAAITKLAIKHSGKLFTSGGSQSGHGPVPALPVASTSSGMGPHQLQEIERLLVQHVGPIASVLVSRTAKKAVGTRQFYMMLAEHITDGAKRSKFLRDVGLG